MTGVLDGRRVLGVDAWMFVSTAEEVLRELGDSCGEIAGPAERGVV